MRFTIIIIALALSIIAPAQGHCASAVLFKATLSASPAEIIQPTTFEASTVELPMEISISGGGGLAGSLGITDPDSPVFILSAWVVDLPENITILNINLTLDIHTEFALVGSVEVSGTLEVLE